MENLSREFDNFRNACEPCDAPKETAKNIIENTGAILGELANTLNMVESALLSPRVNTQEPVQNPRDLCLYEMLSAQRNLAEDILHTAARIREVLW